MQKTKERAFICGIFASQIHKSLLLNRSVKTILENLRAKISSRVCLKNTVWKFFASNRGLSMSLIAKDILINKINYFPNSIAIIEKYSCYKQEDEQFRFYYYLQKQTVKKYLERFLEDYQKGIKDVRTHFFKKMINIKKEQISDC